ncbi:MAG: hypothetical protein D6739_12715 [Nitrospirae bacterium]|nr:MAG: hypothetical protein D6739_12715 [Nitrospirota bacterium]
MALPQPAGAGRAWAAGIRRPWPLTLLLLLSLPWPSSAAVHLPRHRYVLLITSERGIHCTSFDFRYCAMVPPFASVLVQAVRTEGADGSPARLLGPGDGVELHYGFVGNSYSAGNKLAYWGVKYDVDRNMRRLDPFDQPPVEFVRPFYTYRAGVYDGLRPPGAGPEDRVYLWRTRSPGVDQGPLGEFVVGWPNLFRRPDVLRYTGPRGVRLFVEGAHGSVDLPYTLAPPRLWAAVGLPLTPYLDASRGSKPLESGREVEYQPYQRVVVTLRRRGEAAGLRDRDGSPVRFMGVIPVDAPSCDRCHGSRHANGAKAHKYQEEYDYWIHTFGRATPEYAATKAAAVSLLELHDRNEHTHFTWDYSPRASGNRLGRQPVFCPSCHADNAIGRLRMNDSPATNVADTRVRAREPIVEAIHLKHAAADPAPDSRGRPGNCQMCHPAHADDGRFDRFPVDPQGRNRYAAADNRDALGFYTGRDVHSNPYRRPALHTRSHLNAIGRWYRDHVWSEGGRERGLYCTHCHSPLSQALYASDHLRDAATGAGAGLRAEGLKAIAAALTGGDMAQLVARFLDPKVVAGEDRSAAIWRRGRGAFLGYRLGDGRIVPGPDAPPGGRPVRYGDVSDAADHSFSPSLPHCADCHAPPFVESEGGPFFPADQPGKYSLARLSRAHAGITCYGCHQATHGLWPVNPLGHDEASPQQALQYNADGTAGPVQCSACHRTTPSGVPLVARERRYRGRVVGDDYEAAVAWAHADR